MENKVRDFSYVGRKERTLAFSSVPLHCNPDFPTFDPFSLCKFESVAKLLTNTSLIQSFRTFLSCSITVTQIWHKKEESKQRMTNSITNFFDYMKNRMQLKPPQLILAWRSHERGKQDFQFLPKRRLFSSGYKRKPKNLKFSGSEKLLLNEKLHPIQRDNPQKFCMQVGERFHPSLQSI